MKAVIQAGGKGTRISSITKDLIPKSMLEVGSKPLLYHQVMNLKDCGIKDIIIIIGHLGEVIKDYFEDGSSLGVNISYYEEKDPLGTAGALYYLKKELKEDFLFILGDVFLDIDFNKMIKFHQDKKAKITLFTHPNNHPYDSDLIVVDEENLVLKFDYKTNNRKEYYYFNLVNAGVMIFSSEVLKQLKEEKPYSYEKDIVAPLIKENSVYSYQSTEYVKDMGTPERYRGVLEEYNKGIPKQKNLKNKQKCIFIDRDGTINKFIPFLTDINKFKLIKGVSKAISKINKSDYLCIVITNQPIIARGDSTVKNLNEIHKKMDVLLSKKGAFIDKLYYCPHHPDKGFEGEVKELKIKCDCRKPGTLLIEKAASEFNIDIKNSFFIGDTTSDIMCAKNAGLKSILVETGEAGLDNKYDVKEDYKAKNLLEAVNLILGGSTMDFKKGIKEYYEREIRALKDLDLDSINESMNAIYETYKNGGTIYVCGNGGSASTASHIQNDFNKGISEHLEEKFNFHSLSDNISTITAIANDIGYEEIFKFQIENKITDNDLLLAISGSGNSVNVINAAIYAKKRGAKVIAMTGFDGGMLKEIADYSMHADIEDMQITEDIHLSFDHMMMKVFYNYLVKNEISGKNE